MNANGCTRVLRCTFWDPTQAPGRLAAMDAGARLGAHAHRRPVPRETITVKVYSEVSGHEAILALIKLGCGVGIVPELVLEKSPLRGELRVLDVRPRLAPFRVAACIKRLALKAPLTGAFWASIGG